MLKIKAPSLPNVQYKYLSIMCVLNLKDVNHYIQKSILNKILWLNGKGKVETDITSSY